MRVLAIDHGERRIGLALSDPTGTFAMPLEVVEGEDVLFERIRQLIAEKGVGRIVLGLPINMDGSIGPRARKTMEFGEHLAATFGLHVELWDERLTSVQAEKLLRMGGGSGRRRRALVDKVAAQILLQSYLDSPRRSEAGGGPVGHDPGREESSPAGY